LADFEKIIKKLLDAARDELRATLPELNEAVQHGDGSISFTLQVKRKGKKKRNLTAMLTTRVRAPREPIELALHIDDSNQMALGFVPEDEDDEDDDGEETRGGGGDRDA
jgi:hypothetical protein